jgi:hypothetical protein
MKRLFFISILLFIGHNVTSQVKQAIVRNDNDYVTYNDTYSQKEKLPSEVLKKFKSVSDTIENVRELLNYKVKVSDSIDAYILIVNSSNLRQAFIVFHNEKEHKTSSKFIGINLKWAFNNENGFDVKLLAAPLIRIETLNGKIFIYLKERTHNGNVYNAVVNKVYEITDDLVTTLKFCFEESALLEDGSKLNRILHDKEIVTYRIFRNQITKVGSITLNNTRDSIVDRICSDSNFCELLFTSSGIKDEQFLKEGYTFKY